MIDPQRTLARTCARCIATEVHAETGQTVAVCVVIARQSEMFEIDAHTIMAGASPSDSRALLTEFASLLRPAIDTIAQSLARKYGEPCTRRLDIEAELAAQDRADDEGAAS